MRTGKGVSSTEGSAVAGQTRTTARLFLLTACLTGIAIGMEFLGAQKLILGGFSLVLLPLFFAFVIALLANLGLLRWRPLSAAHMWPVAGRLLGFLAMIFVVRAGMVLGEALPTIAGAGPAVLLQSLGKMGTALAFPAAIMLGLGRASVGATFSIGREPSIALINERYGIAGPEGFGVLATYICGTLFGSLIFSALASLGSAIPAFSPTALAMACGVGSGGMTMSCAGALAHDPRGLAPNDILALATASDVLAYGATVVLGAFLVLPVLDKLSRRVGGSVANPDPSATGTAPATSPSPLMIGVAAALAVVAIAAWRTIPSVPQLPGLFVLVAGTVAAMGLASGTGRFIPGVLWAALIGVALTAPALPWSAGVTGLVSGIELLPLATVVLACAGFCVTAPQLRTLRLLSWRAVLVAVLVFAGSFFSSALIAQTVLSLGGGA